MRLLHAIHDFLPRHRAGSEIYAHHLAHELARRHAVTILCAEYDPARAHGSLTWRDSRRPARRGAREQLGVLELRRVVSVARPEPVAAARARGDRSRRAARAQPPEPVDGSAGAGARARGGDGRHAPRLHAALPVGRPARAHGGRARVPRDRPGAVQPLLSAVTVGHRRWPSADAVARSRACRRSSGWPTSSGGGSPARSRRSSRASARPRPLTAADIVRRLDKARQVFDTIDLFVAPSQALADEYRAAGMPPGKLRVVDYGFRRAAPLAARAGSPPAARLRRHARLAQGRARADRGAAGACPQTAVELKVFGSLEVFPAYVKTLREQARDLPVRFMGPFDQDRAQDVYSQIDVLVVPSLWPENSPLVIHEAFMAASRRRRPARRHSRARVGRRQRADLRGVLARVSAGRARAADRPSRSWSRRFAARLPAVRTIEEDAAGWEAIYASVTRRTAAGRSA